MSEPEIELDVEFRSVRKCYGDTVVLDHFDLPVERGTFLSILGPSGSGKTTSLRLIAGFDSPTSGDIRIRGASVVGVPAHRRAVNMVFQQYALFPHMTVAQNISYGLLNQRPRLARTEIHRRVDEALELVQLQGFGPRGVQEMSGGQQQRVALARALINRPSVLLLDEPMAALDRKLREEMQHELQSLQRILGITFILVTHDQEEAMSMSDIVCLMNQGRIVQKGSSQELYDHPVNAFVAGFVGKSNLIRGAATIVQADVVGIEAPGLGPLLGRRASTAPAISLGDPLTMSIRPEVVAVAAHKHDLDQRLDVRLEGRIVNHIFLGDVTEYRIEHDGLGSILAKRSRRAGFEQEITLSEGYVSFGWKSDDVLALS